MSDSKCDSSKDDCDENAVLRIGTEFDSDEHAYKFYNIYAKLLGFNVRKDWVNRSKVHGLVVSRKFTCSKQGYRRTDKRDGNVKKHRKETRTGCLAHMIITRQPHGQYRVTHYEAEHNHDDINPNNAPALLLREELLCVARAAEGDSGSDLGRLSNSDFEVMKREFEVRESLDCLAMDFDNYLRSVRSRDMKEGEAGRLLRYFQRLHFENPAFFYAVQIDVDDKVSNIFWADDKMILDYDHFGDVVCLDTFARTNYDLRPFVQFIGVNHHNQAIIFAAALLFDDTFESFKWLFSTLLETMSGKKPKVILTDQDAAVVEAISSVLPETSHHICVWQMYQNALRHLSHVVKDTECFASDFRRCIYDNRDEEGFLHTWEVLLNKYGLQQNEWLRWMFREREKWAIAYGKNTYFIDMKGKHVAEDLHNNLRSYLNPDQDALEFFKILERVVDEIRFIEMQVNDEMSRSVPRLMGNVIMLRSASDIYTPKAFEIFQREYEKCLNIVVSQCCENGYLLEYKVNTFGQTQEYTVTFNSSDDTIVCSCMKFENVGFLCGHALKVLDNRNIKIVPSQYILKRWTKEAKSGRVREIGDPIAQKNPKLAAASRYKDLTRSILKIAARAADSAEAFQFASRQLDEVIEGMDKILTLKSEMAQGISACSTAADGSGSENAECFLDDKAIEDQEENNGVAGTKENEIFVPDGHQLRNVKDKIYKKKRLKSDQIPSSNTINCISSTSKACVSVEVPTTNPILQGFYNFEANQAVQCMHEQQNPIGNDQANSNMYQQSNLYSNQHDSPSQTPLLQEIDLDLHPPHSSPFLLFDHRFRASDPSYYGLK